MAKESLVEKRRKMNQITLQNTLPQVFAGKDYIDSDIWHKEVSFEKGHFYLIEAASDIIQVGVFKLSGRKIRVFKMAPIHHHFEQCGWSEIKIVFIFSLVTLAFCTLAYFGI